MAEPFEVLGISPIASLDDARTAFKRLAMLYHPDRYAESTEGVRREAEAKMRDLNAAFAELVARRRGGPEPEEILASEKWLADWWDARERNRLEDQDRRARFKRWDEIEQARLDRSKVEAEAIASVWRSVYGEKKEDQPQSPLKALTAGEPRPGSLADRLRAAKAKNATALPAVTGYIAPANGHAIEVEEHATAVNGHAKANGSSTANGHAAKANGKTSSKANGHAVSKAKNVRGRAAAAK